MTEYTSLIDGSIRRNTRIVLFALSGLLSLILLGGIYTSKEAIFTTVNVVNISLDQVVVGDSFHYSENVKKSLERISSSSVFQLDSDHLKPFLSMSSKYVGAPKYNIASCSIEKSMSTVMQRVMCYVFDREAWDRKNLSIEKMEWSNRFCYNKNEFMNSTSKLKAFSKDHETIFITRDPIARFLSGFMDKCVNEKASCYGCVEDVLCVVDGFYNETKRITREYDEKKKNGTLPCMSYHGSHFAPQTWHCDLADHYESYCFVKYEEDPVGQLRTNHDLLKVFQEHKVPNDMLKYLLFRMTAPTKHVTKTSSARQEHEGRLRSSEKHMKQLNEIYYYDFLIFGFTPPIETL